MSESDKIRERLAAGDRFALAEVRRWMNDSGDLGVWSAVYDLLGSAIELIEPELSMDEARSFAVDFLLRCIHEDPQYENDELPTGYEAAHNLADCLKYWASKQPQSQPVLTDAAACIAAAYRAADDDERDRLVNGCLEHALETAAVRSYFEQWRNDLVLKEPWRLAMEWGLAHGDPVVE
jgi:hypothetical protein